MIKNWILLLCIACTVSCSKFSKLQKSDDLEVKKQGAFDYYDKKDYFRASQLLEELVPLLKGTQDAEKAEYLYAMCQYQQRVLETATYFFDTFLETYPRSQFTEEATYMSALSQYENSPSYYLDQSNTDKAISGLENFIIQYPESERRVKCQQMVDNLNDKLEKKAFENARIFYQITEYKAAVIALANFAKDYPNSPMKEEALYLRILSIYSLAKISTDAKKPERYQQTIDYYTNFVDNFPTSKYVKPLESVFESSTSRLAKVKKDKIFLDN